MLRSRFLPLFAVFALIAAATRAAPPITAVAFSPGDKRVLAGSQSGVTVYSWPDLEELAAMKTDAANLHDLEFAPDGNRLAVAGGFPGEEGSVEIFSWPELRTLTVVRPHSDCVVDVCWTNNDTIVSAGLDHRIHQTSVSNGDVLQTFQGHSKGVKAIAVIDKTNLLVSSGIDQSLRTWRLDSAELRRSLAIHSKPVGRIAVRPHADGLPMIATASDDRTVRLWQPTIGRMVRFARLDSPVRDVAWTHDGTSLFAACNNGTVYRVDPDTVEVMTVEKAVDGWAYAIAIAQDNGSAVVGGANGKLARLSLR